MTKVIIEDEIRCNEYEDSFEKDIDETGEKEEVAITINSRYFSVLNT
ncbi:MAG: hypothetical protein ACOC1D_05605 [Prolixibacteraceae bacterium]